MHVLFSVLMLVASLNLVAQETKSLVAEYISVNDILVTKDGKTSSAFSVSTDKATVQEIQRQAETMKNYLTLDVKADKEQTNKYNMNLQYSYEVPVRSIHKMLLLFGFSDVKIEKRAYPLDQLLTIKN